MQRAYWAACALLLSSVALAAGPLKTPTARPGTCFNSMVADIKQHDRPGQGYGIIFYGDSIVETLKGTDKCRDCTAGSQRRSSCAGAPQVLQKYFGKYQPGVMGMSMDETAHLLYRLMNGQIPKVNKPKVAILLIGANDMTNSGWSMTDKAKKEKALAQTRPGTVARIQQAVQLLRAGGKSQVLLLGVLPRGTGTGKGLKNEQNDFSWPSHYAKAIAAVNADLKAYADKTAGVSFIDCGAVFLKGRAIDAGLMADGIHPTGAGWDKLAACIAPTVAQLYASA